MPNNISSALGYAQFQRIDELIAKKHWILEEYRENLKELKSIKLNCEPEYIYNSAWITTIVLDKKINISKQEFIDKLINLSAPLAESDTVLFLREPCS